MKALRIYVDTSVFGGCFDAGFVEDSERCLDAVRRGYAVALVSEFVLKELVDAPERVQERFASLPAPSIERLDITPPVLALRDAYLAAGIVGPRWKEDAAHVAAATVARADAIISWNFRHVVRLDKIKRYNQVNLLNGWGILTILSPREVTFDADADE